MYQKHLEHAERYLEKRGLSPATAEGFRLGVVADPASGHESMVGRLCIPSIGPGRNVYLLKFRCIEDHDCRDVGHSKYLTDAQDNRLFNLRALVGSGDTICITEGEIDAITLVQLGYAAVAAPGVSTWKRHHPRLFAGFSKVYVFGDGDKPGRDFVKTVCTSLSRGIRVHLPDGEDVNSLYVRSGETEILELMGVTG